MPEKYRRPHTHERVQVRKDAARVGSRARCAGDGAPFQCATFGQGLLLVLAEDWRSPHRAPSLACDCVRQLWDRGGPGLTGEAS